MHFLSNDLSFNSFGAGNKKQQYKSLSPHIGINITLCVSKFVVRMKTEF